MSFSLLSDADLHLFNEGTHRSLAEKLGSHIINDQGTYFAVWAPNARSVSVIGNFNGWRGTGHPLVPRASSGIWEGLIGGLGAGEIYKYEIVSEHGERFERADPLAYSSELPPATGSIVADLNYVWSDQSWMADRGVRNARNAPTSIYEMHLGSWRRDPDNPTRLLSYGEIAQALVAYVSDLGFSHVELLPVMEHPFYGSWGYQVTGFFAPSARYGSPQEFMAFVDVLHQHGIGVILDWVPSHFPNDAFALARFDGTHLYEHADPRLGVHPDWGSLIFNYGRHEVRSFLSSSAEYWLARYHVDGLRVDAVASMLYLDYSRKAGEWIPNRFGGRENLEAIDFLRELNSWIYLEHPDVQTFAEESTAWPGVSRPVDFDGLGFGYKWDMGWMHDTLSYMSRDPLYRRYHHGEITFRGLYMFSENYTLPLSHDEVTHGKGSLLAKMPGDRWQRFSNLRLLYGYQYSQPGKKLLFMGDEFAHEHEWDHDSSLDWHLLDLEAHAGMRNWVRDLNRVYAEEPALHELDTEPAGFEWVRADDAVSGVISYLRWSETRKVVLAVMNFTPVPRYGYELYVPFAGSWKEIANSDALEYGGSGIGNLGGIEAIPAQHSPGGGVLQLTVPPLGIVLLKALR